VAASAEIGPRTRVWSQCQIREGARIGEDCILGRGVVIDLGVQIGDNVKIQAGVFIPRGVTLESGVFVGPGVIFTNDLRPRAITPDGRLKQDTDWQIGRSCVRYGASIGAGAVVLPDLTIGRFALVAAGAVVARDVPDHGLVAGNPARRVGYVCRCAATLSGGEQGRYRCPSCHDEYDEQQFRPAAQ
jgi:acetyltransferase-like isoleucine patch superfamily enzyme